MAWQWFVAVKFVVSQEGGVLDQPAITHVFASIMTAWRAVQASDKNKLSHLA